MVVNATGCGQKAVDPIPLPVTEAQRENFGSVGVVTVRFTPDEEFETNTRGVGTGIAKGAGAGALSGAAHGVSFLGSGLRGGCSSDAAFLCAATVVLLLPVFIVGGAIVGGIAGGATAVPEGEAQEIEALISDTLLESDAQGEVRRAVLRKADAERGATLSAIHDLGTAAGAGLWDTEAAVAEGIDTVLEVTVMSIGLAGGHGGDPKVALFIEARARMIDAQTEEVIQVQKWLTYRSEPRRFTEWGVEEGRLLKAEIEEGYDRIAENVIDQMFLERRWH